MPSEIIAIIFMLTIPFIAGLVLILPWIIKKIKQLKKDKSALVFD